MQIANTHATGAPAPMDKGLTPNTPPCSTGRCTLHSNTVLEAVIESKRQRDLDGRGSAYNKLLQHFHQAILPAFLAEGGSISEASKLLGIHRETLTRYIDTADIKLAATSAGGAV